MLWDLYCRVIDNHGDLGVCLRLALDLTARAEQVRLWVDQPAALGWLCPVIPAGLAVHPWPDQECASDEPADVVIEAFGCELPMAAQRQLGERGRLAASGGAKPLWLNLEYLSAEPYARRCHLLPSPLMQGPGQGMVKTFWYPGFVAGSGGLIRELDLVQRSLAVDHKAFLAQLGVAPVPGERVVSVFCYPHAPLQALIEGLAATPTVLLMCGGVEAPPMPESVRVARLPWLNQSEYDTLLASCDLNVIRGEDSFVRAQWAGRPMLWHIYAQADGAHAAKLEAFMDLYFASLDGTEASLRRNLWRSWNGLHTPELLRTGAAALFDSTLPAMWREQLLGQADLVTQLLAWCSAQRCQR